MSNAQKAIKAVYFSIVGNLVLALLKGLGGYFGNSYALIADAIESSTDVFTSVLVLVGLRYAQKPADKDHPYGHGRAEPLLTFMVVGFLVLSAGIIAYQSVQNILTPHALPKPYTLIILGGIIVWKELSYRWMLRRSTETQSTALKADAWHHRSDAITSLAAMVGIGIALVLGPGYEAADDLAALLAVGFILYNCYHIFRPALSEIMDEHLYDDFATQIAQTSLEVEGIIYTEKCFIRKTGMQYFVDLHAVVQGNLTVKQGHLLAHNLKDKLLQTYPQIADVLVHIEPDDIGND